MRARIMEEVGLFLERYIQTKSPDDDLFEAGFLNSLFSMQLILFIENTYEIELLPDDMTHENLRTLNSITDLINNKLNFINE